MKIKKISTIVITAILLTGLMGCSESKVPQSIPENTNRQTDTQNKNESILSCAGLSHYQNETWYPELAKNKTLLTENLKTIENPPERIVTLQEVADACFLRDNNFLILLIPGEYAQGPTIYRFDTATFKLEKAVLQNYGRAWLASPVKFGKREGNIIHMEGTSGDAGFGSKMYFEYNFINNVVELKKEYSYSADDPENGTWVNYRQTDTTDLMKDNQSKMSEQEVLRIAKQAGIHKFGEKAWQEYEPYKAEFVDGIWKITGTLYYEIDGKRYKNGDIGNDGNPVRILGGTIEVKISDETSEVLEIYHSQ